MKSGICWRDRMPRRTRSAASASRRTGSAMVLASDSDSTSITAASTTKKRRIAQRSEAITRSMSPPCVESCSAPRVAIMCWIGTATETIVSPSSLIRTADFGLALQRLGDLGHRLAVDEPRVVAARRIRRRGEEIATERRSTRSKTPLALGRIGQIGAHHRAVRRKRARVEQEPAVAVVDARARMRRRDEAVEHRSDAFGIDGELDGLLVAFGGAAVWPGRELQQLVRIDGDRVGVDRRRGGDRRRDDVGLGRQALHRARR